jgi:hypothetical protein
MDANLFRCVGKPRNEFNRSCKHSVIKTKDYIRQEMSN